MSIFRIFMAIFISCVFEAILVGMQLDESVLKENTLASLTRGIELTDGIEFDVRTTLDNELIVHHDKKLAVSEKLRGDLPIFVENNKQSDLMNLGFPSLSEVIENSKISTNLREHGKIMNIELKLPHPSSVAGAGWFNSRKNIPYVSNMLSKCAELLEEAEIPKHSIIFYGFFKHMNYSAKKINFDWNVSSLFPNQLRFGTRKLNRIYASREFVFRSLNSMIKLQKKRKSPILPCGLEYFIPPYNGMRFDKKYGLSGRQLERLLKLKKGFPIYIWPGLIEQESLLYDAGISILSDSVNSTENSLADGSARWIRHSTQPLDNEWHQKFKNTEPENHKGLVDEAIREVPPWSELNSIERKKFLEQWRKKWYWEKPLEHYFLDSGSNKLPWESVRVIGHRGCGSTSRPIFF